jgi:RNA 2',3'-cyclic 3'-phosphodiesterase
MRLFVAVDIPAEVRAAISAAVAKLRPAAPKARWVRIEGLHVTLKFIGETPEENVGAIGSALTAVPPCAPIDVRFRGLGFFPNPRRPRVFWAGVEAGPKLAALAASVDAALNPLGAPGEERAFAPHLTLARFDPPHAQEALHAAIEKSGPLEFGSATAAEFHLYQSVLKRGGAEYTRLATFPLQGSQHE